MAGFAPFANAPVPGAGRPEKTDRTGLDRGADFPRLEPHRVVQIGPAMTYNSFMVTAVLPDDVFYSGEQNGTIRLPLNTPRLISDMMSGGS
jgi:hypothetical protein